MQYNIKIHELNEVTLKLQIEISALNSYKIIFIHFYLDVLQGKQFIHDLVIM